MLFIFLRFLPPLSDVCIKGTRIKPTETMTIAVVENVALLKFMVGFELGSMNGEDVVIVGTQVGIKLGETDVSVEDSIMGVLLCLRESFSVALGLEDGETSVITFRDDVGDEDGKELCEDAISLETVLGLEVIDTSAMAILTILKYRARIPFIIFLPKISELLEMCSSFLLGNVPS